MVSHIRLYDSKFFKSWEAFAERLSETYDRPSSDAEDIIVVRQLRYAIVIGALGQLLEDLKERDLAGEFHALSSAFMDLSEGVIDPIFVSQKKEKKKGRANDTTDQWLLRASVVIGIRFLMAGELEEDAAYKVAQKHKKGLAHLLRPGAELKSSLRTWVESFDAEKVTNELAVDTYKEGLARLHLLKQGFLKEVLRTMGDSLIQKAAERATSRFPRKI
jgi:hypothetical protein